MKKRTRSLSFTVALCIVILAGANAALGQCNLEDPPCPGAGPCGFTCALGGCLAATPVAHTTITACTGGSFDLIGTRYETTCATGVSCTKLVPPLRFWGYDMYTTANHGCGYPGPAGGEWHMNTGIDFGFGIPGHWHFKSANWQSCAVDGCPAGDPTVVELSDVRESLEGTPDHDAWYIAASVDFVTGGYNFDRITGATEVGGCGEGSIPALSVPGVILDGALCPDNGSEITTTENPVDPSYSDIQVTLENPTPDYFTDRGHNDLARPLISGMQITYFIGADAPTTSEGSAWLPTRNPANPAFQIAGVVPWGFAGEVTVSVPKGTDAVWVAARIVYLDSTVNPVGPTPIGFGPQVMTPVGRSCGPIDAAANLNLAPVAIISGGPHDGVCGGGVLGIWMDGEASFDADVGDVITYPVDDHLCGAVRRSGGVEHSGGVRLQSM